MGPHPPRTPSQQQARDREVEAWLERALGTTRPDPEPVVHDLDG